MRVDQPSGRPRAGGRGAAVAGLVMWLASLACTCSDPAGVQPDDPLPDTDTDAADTDTDDAELPAGKVGKGKGKGRKGKVGKSKTPAPVEPDPGGGGGDGGGGGGGGGTEPEGPSAGIEYLGDNRWNVERRLVDRYTSDPDQLGCTAFEKGKGWEVTGSGPHTDCRALGANNGDLLLEANGMSLDTTADLLLVWSRLENEDDLTLKLQRDGASVTQRYHIVD